MDSKISSESWIAHSQLVLSELKRLNSNYEELRKEMALINTKLSEIKTLEETIKHLEEWKTRVNDVMSPSQMKELKDEVYRQKNRWTATIAILAFLQVVLGLLAAFKDKLFN